MVKEYLKINLASPSQILKWAERSLPNGQLIGKVTKFETVNYKNFKPISGGLFCEKIFGPEKDYQCLCKLYKKIKIKKIKNKITICPNCHVQITSSNIRRYRMGFIELNFPSVHKWFFKNNPSYISSLLLEKSKNLDSLIYQKSYISITKKNNETIKSGGDAIKFLLKRLKSKDINKILTIKELNKLKLLNYFIETKTKPIWMVLTILPVLPPETRPIIKLPDNNIVSSDYNNLYENIINTNNKIKQLENMNVSEKFIKLERIKLQISTDALINAKYNNLKSISNSIKGKSGRIRENILGKTIDFSARSVIAVEPKLKVNECGIPEEIFVKLFQPLIINKILNLKIYNNIRKVKIEINTEKNKNLVRKIIKTLCKEMRKKQIIMLNRAPTLHRIGLQTFTPKITKSKVIKLHPMVCSAFNADFDGDQMGIHIPLSLKAQAEARTLMISINNNTMPSTGKANIIPSQDMILGCYFLTCENNSIFYLLKKIIYYKNKNSILQNYKTKKIDIHSYIWIKLNSKNTKTIKLKQEKKQTIFRSTPGRIIFSTIINQLL
uniref:DNA-directed RNA polymerase subunit n=1 Tax=Lepocinclis tripteris TaxID=135494 RepID=A0A3G3LL25_9EUGL|nr:RNA polymerase beta' subunit [Lepocinclis tripteris]